MLEFTSEPSKPFGWPTIGQEPNRSLATGDFCLHPPIYPQRPSAVYTAPIRVVSRLPLLAGHHQRVPPTMVKHIVRRHQNGEPARAYSPQLQKRTITYFHLRSPAPERVPAQYNSPSKRRRRVTVAQVEVLVHTLL